LRSCLNNIVFSIFLPGSLNILRGSFVYLLNVFADLANLLHEGIPEVLVSHKLVLSISNSPLSLILNRIAVKESSTSESWKIFAVGVTSENKTAVSYQLNWFVWIRIHSEWLLIWLQSCLLCNSEAKGLTWSIRDKRLSKSSASLHIHLSVKSICWIGCMNHICVLGFHDPLNEHGHEHLVKLDSNLLDCQESSLVELGCPNLLDGCPSLGEV